MRRALLIGAAVLIAGCGDIHHGGARNDAPVGRLHEKPRQIWLAPDKFPNVAAWCIGVNGIYTHTRNPADAVDVVVNDPNCAEGGILRNDSGD